MKEAGTLNAAQICGWGQQQEDGGGGKYEEESATYVRAYAYIKGLVSVLRVPSRRELIEYYVVVVERMLSCEIQGPSMQGAVSPCRRPPPLHQPRK